MNLDSKILRTIVCVKMNMFNVCKYFCSACIYIKCFMHVIGPDTGQRITGHCSQGMRCTPTYFIKYRYRHMFKLDRVYIQVPFKGVVLSVIDSDILDVVYIKIA